MSSKPAPARYPFFSFFPETPTIDWLGWSKVFVPISALAVAGGLVVVFGFLKFGLDFTGGTQITVQFTEPKAIGDVRAATAALQGGADVMEYERNPRKYIIKTPSVSVVTPERRARVVEDLKAPLAPWGFDATTFVESEGGGNKFEFRLKAAKPAPATPAAPAAPTAPNETPTPAAQPGLPPVPGVAAADVANLPPEIQDAILKGAPAAAPAGEPGLPPVAGVSAPDVANLPPEVQDVILNGTPGTAAAAPTPPAAAPAPAEAAPPAESKPAEAAAVLPQAEITPLVKTAFAAADLHAYEVHFDATGEPDVYRVSVVLQGVYYYVKQALDAKFGAGTHELLSLQTVGPKVGDKLKNDGIAAVLYALIGIFLYIMFRFELKYAPGAVVCLIHDVVITTAFLSLVGVEFTLTTLAALLTIVGYSVNDTIVAFDRMRENDPLLKSRSVEEVVNASINQTLSRTILTSLTTFLTVTAVWALGGGEIENFGLAMMVGLIIGTYSTIMVASPIMIWFHYRLRERAAAESAAKHTRRRRPAGAPA